MIEPQVITIDGTQYWYTHYKAPFRQLPGALPGCPIGVPVVDEFGKLLCPYCKPARTFDNLSKHVGPAHAETASQFRARAGWMSSTPLMSARLLARHAENLRSRVARPGATPFRYNGPRPSTPTTNGKLTPEWANKYGHCQDQIAAVAKSLHAKGQLDRPHLRAQHINEPSIVRWFGSREAFIEQFGWDGRRRVRKWTDEALLGELREQARLLGRTPTQAELGGLAVSLHKHFGSLAQAVTLVGLEPRPKGAFKNDRAGILRAYAALGEPGEVGRTLGCGRVRVMYVLNSLGFPGSSDPHRREWAAEMAKRLAGVAA